MSDSHATDLRSSRSVPPGESAAARDTRALLDASDAGAPRKPENRLGTVQELMRQVWDEVSAQQAEIEALREQVADARDAAEHALSEQKESERAAADREAELSADVRAKAEEIRFLGAQQALATAEVRRLHDALNGAKGTAARTEPSRPEAKPAPVRPVPRPDPPPVPAEAPRQTRRPEPSPPPAEETVTLEALYRTFCREAGGLNSNPELFATSLRRAFPAAEVRTVYRDADSPARPIVLTAERRGNSAVPFWAVSVDGHHGLVPQPMGTDQFRELAPCFTGQAAPASLAEIDPAPLSTFGAGFELTRPGRVA